jgi:VWFA-related protein
MTSSQSSVRSSHEPEPAPVILRLAPIGLLLLWLGTRAAPQEAPQPTFPSEAELVKVDVVVTGDDGEPVPGLRPEDFTVAEDGVVQPVVVFEAIHREAPQAPVPVPAPPVPELRVSTNRPEAAREGSHFLIVFDELHLDPAEAARSREAVRQFLAEQVAAGDLVALVGTFEGTRWTARLPDGKDALLQVLDRLQGRLVNVPLRDRMTDYEAMRIDRYRDPLVTDVVMRRLLESGEIDQDTASPGNPTTNLDNDVVGWRGEVLARAAQVYARATARNQQTLGVVEVALAPLAALRGRKSLLFVSGGLIADPHLAAARQVVESARRANAAIYFVDARGLSAAPFGLSAEAPQRTFFQDLGSHFTEARERREGSEGLAADTGGFSLRDQNDLAGGLARIAREARSYYLLGYAPANQKADGRFRSIEVRVSRPGTHVRARRGYYAPGGDRGRQAVPGRDAAMQQGLDAPFDLPELPLRAIAHVFGPAEPGQVAVWVTIEADIRALAFAEEGDTARDTLELLLLVVDRVSGESFRFDQQYDMKLSRESRARYEKGWFPIARELRLKPGAYRARIVARDANNGRLGSVTHDFEVPEAAGLRLSSLVLSDQLHEEGSTSSAPALSARRHFAPAGVLHCRFEIYGAAPDKAAGQPNVTAGFAIRRSDGGVLAAMPETPLRPADDGALSRSLGAPLDGAPPGTYQAIVVATDLVSGRTAEARETFVIEERAKGSGS